MAVSVTSFAPTLIHGERQRTYRFPGDEFVRIVGVVELSVRESGNHRLKDSSGKLHIVRAGWIHIEIVAEEWTV
jgi:hypothetical protein